MNVSEWDMAYARAVAMSAAVSFLFTAVSDGHGTARRRAVLTHYETASAPPYDNNLARECLDQAGLGLYAFPSAAERRRHTETEETMAGGLDDRMAKDLARFAPPDSDVISGQRLGIDGGAWVR